MNAGQRTSSTISGPVVGASGSLNIVDDCSRLCIGQLVDVCIFSTRMVQWLEEIIESRGQPCALLLDNGPEMISQSDILLEPEAWCQAAVHLSRANRLKHAFIESFNGRFRDGCLNQHWFKDLADA
jgi:putative transposase